MNTLKINIILRLLIFALAGSASVALAQTPNYTSTTSSALDTWSTASSNGNWSNGAELTSGASTSMDFEVGETFSGGTSTVSNPTTITSTNDLGTFLLNGLTLGGATANYGPVTFNITGGTLDFVANGSTDPTIDLAGTSSNGSSSLLTYNISSAVNFAADTTITNTATSTQAAFYQFSGPISGNGNLTISAGSKGIVALGTGATTYLELNDFYAYTGNLEVSSGTVANNIAFSGGTTTTTGAATGNDFFSLGALTVDSGATYDLGASYAAFSSISGSGIIKASGVRTLFVNDVGQTPDDFTGTFGTSVSIALDGDGTLALPALTGAGYNSVGFSLYVYGNGLVSTVQQDPSGTQSTALGGAYLYATNGVLEYTRSGDNSGIIGIGNVLAQGGTLYIRPSASSHRRMSSTISPVTTVTRRPSAIFDPWEISISSSTRMAMIR